MERVTTSMRTEGLYQDLVGDWITCFFTASFVPGLQLKTLAQQFNGFRMFTTKEVRVKICVLERQGVNSRTNLLQQEQHIRGTDLPLRMWQLMYPKQKSLKFA